MRVGSGNEICVDAQDLDISLNSEIWYQVYLYFIFLHTTHGIEIVRFCFTGSIIWGLKTSSHGSPEKQSQ